MPQLQLQVRIDRQQRTANFSGSGTFHLKDQIKALGNSKWIGATKQWQISGYSWTHEQLRAHFPSVDIQILEEAFASETEQPDSESRGASGPVSNIASGNSLAEISEFGTPGRPTTFAQFGLTPVESATKQALGSSSVLSIDTALSVSPNAVSVSQLTVKIQSLLRRTFAQPVIIYGVLAKVNHSRGRIFLELADRANNTEMLQCVIWENAEELTAGLTQAGFALEPNLEVMFEVRVDLNRKNGTVSLNILKIISEYTLSKLLAEREKTNQRLRDEGLFDRNRLTSLSFLPRRLGILTSSAGTVINDFLSGLDVAKFGFELFHVHVNVQGESAKAQVVLGIQKLLAVENLDAILLFRGGGSQVELGVFNQYEIAKAICLCPLPVFSAIGHQEDQCSTQDVSFKAFGVPKDLGVFFANIVLDIRRRVSDSSRQIFIRVNDTLFYESERLSQSSRTAREKFETFVERREEQLRAVSDGVPKMAAGLLQSEARQFRAMSEYLLDASRTRGSQLQERLDSILNTIRGKLELSTAQQEKTLSTLARGLPLMGGVAVQLEDRQVRNSTKLLLESSRATFARVSWRLSELVNRTEESVSRRIEISTQRFEQTAQIIPFAVQALTRSELALEALERIVTEASPEVQLKRGYALLRDTGGKPIMRVSELQPGDEVKISLQDGTKSALIKNY